MRFKFPLRSYNPRELIRLCNYGEWKGNEEHETSYVRRLRGYDYPRFHVYLKEFDGGFEVDLHLDQKKPTYEGVSAHAGEYEGAVVENEARRITAVIQKIYESK